MSPELASGATRVALGIEYDGTAYCGWQTQPHAPSVQDNVQAALSLVADEPVTCIAAGRTDTGVHATGQVIHFESRAERSGRAWVMGLNANLPADIAVRWARPVSQQFHARYSALWRSYRYRILNRPIRSALERNAAWWVYGAVDVAAMAQAAQLLLGQHDFSAFRAAACQAKTAIRTVFRLDVCREGELIVIDCQANAFLHHMVRNIVGSLMRVGQGEAEPAWVGRILAGRDRRLSGMTAPACGLTLNGVGYPPEFGVPPAQPWSGD